MSALKDAFCSRNAVSLDPFEPQTVIVQSFGLGQWLKIETARQFGIAANIHCILPATFLWQLYQSLVPEAANLRQSPFDRDRLTWRVMRILKSNPALAEGVSGYLNSPGDPDQRAFQLASEIALLFDEYLMYRPDWLNQWQYSQGQITTDDSGTNTTNQRWQAELWRLILADLPPDARLHRAELHRRAMHALATPSQASLPWSRLSVFGISTMPPLQLATFEALAADRDVDLFFLNPCEHYWGDIVSERDVAKRSLRTLINSSEPLLDEDYLEVGNPLLASLGKQGREFLELLLELPSLQTHEAFIEPDTNSALGLVKKDILDLTHGGAFSTGNTPAKTDTPDPSIQVHVCHSRLREIEVLKDEILRATSRDSTLRLNDIVVMVPDITLYAPIIDAAFSGQLPYRIADTGSLEESSLLTAFFKLLRLPELRLTGPEIIDLLQTPAVMRRFNLSSEDMDTLSYWVNAAGIRWELDGQSKADYWGLPPESQNSWRFGLDRLLLGVAMDTNTGSWREVLPFDVTPAETELLATLSGFIDLIAEFRDRLNQAHTIDEWQGILMQLLQCFFHTADDELLVQNDLTLSIEELTEQAVSADYKAQVSRRLILQTLTDRLGDTAQRAGFISGGITFATLVPMRSIPFRIVCLLGMNDGEYPRDVRPHSFDLLAASGHQRGDRSKRLDDRYLFLEALLSAEDTFYVSYLGKGARDNKHRPPSVVVQTWLQYLTSVFSDSKVIEHALQPFNPRYFQGDRLQSFNRHWYEALSSPTGATRFLNARLPIDPGNAPVQINQLMRFYSHPARCFLQQRLGVYLEDDRLALKETESFNLNPLERYQLVDEALSVLIKAGDIDRYRHDVLQSGGVMSGSLGEQQLNREIDRAKEISDAVLPYLNTQRSSINGQIRLNDITLNVDIDHYDKVLVNFRAGKLRARQLIEAWLAHLAASTQIPGVESRLFFRGKDDAAACSILRPVSSEVAEAQLHLLLDGYITGMETPRFQPPEASLNFAENIFSGEPEAVAYRKARQSWTSDMPGSEGQDRYWLRLFEEADRFDETFSSLATSVWLPVLVALDHE